MPDRAGPSLEGRPASGLSEVGVGGHSPTLGGTGSSRPPPQAGPGPIIGFSPSSSTLRGLKKKKKETTTQATRYGPETSRVPGFQEACAGGGGGQGMQRVGAQREGLQKGGQACLLLSLLATMGVHRRAAWKPSPRGAPALGSNPGSGENVGGEEDASSLAMSWAYGVVCVEPERGPEDRAL